ncbi:MAG: mechanosensitive ion channel [Spirochaetaceae bacterium]|nr:mechanosensitive ion channel [Spirochaetaceae bacterium]
MTVMFTQLLSELTAFLDRTAAALAAVGPRLAAALALLLAGVVLAYVVRGVSRRLIRRLARFVSAREARRGRANELRRFADETIGRVLFWTVLLLFALPATETLGVPVVSAWFGGAARYLPQLFAALLIVFGGSIAGRLLADVIARAAPTTGIAHGATLARLAQIATLTVSVLVAVDQAGLSVGFLTDVLLLVLGGGMLAGAITFGLGARATVANILACSQVQKTYRVGHRIRVGDHQGEIVATTATAVVLESDEGRVSVPAAIFDRMVSVRLLERT